MDGAFRNVAGTPRLERALEGLQPRAGLSEAVQAVAFSSDGRLLAAVDLTHPNAPGPPDGRLAIWRVGSGQLSTRRRDLGQPGTAVAFSRDGSALAVAVDDGTVLIVDPSTGRVRRILHPSAGMAASPSRRMGPSRPGHTPGSSSSGTSRQDERSGISPAAWEAHACAVAGRNLTREEWTRFVSGHGYTPVCSGFPAG